ncbi:MAG: M48 family metalloprotease, partial [Planctomycetota bacterium]|nr:M48 family metalloprotease [Planctomycetota bacterium]
MTPGDAVIGVTQGCMRLLNRDELQGVIAHEFSHILNGDMRINIRLMGVLHGILAIAIIGEVVMRIGGYASAGYHHRHHRDRDRGDSRMAIFLFGIALLVIGYVGLFFAKLIKAAVSRQREYLADASAVQFTRNPPGISGALQKIGGLSYGSFIDSPAAEEASHMFFGDALKAQWMDGLATHPPLPERIKRIDPSFDGVFPKVRLEEEERPGEIPAPPPGAPAPAAAVGFAASGRPPPPPPPKAALESGRNIDVQPDELVNRVGTIRTEQLDYAHELVTSFPDELRDAVHEPFGARAVVYCLLLDEEKDVRSKQLEWLNQNAEPAVLTIARDVFPQISRSGDGARLPLVDLALPSLKQLSPSQYEAFDKNVDYLIRADRKVSLFENALLRVLHRHLEQHFNPRRKGPSHYYSLKPFVQECNVLLSTLA